MVMFGSINRRTKSRKVRNYAPRIGNPWLRHWHQWRNYGRQWRQSPPGAPGKGAPRADSNVFLFCYKILSRFVAANDTALNTLRPIRPCFTANNNQLGL